MSVPCTSKLCYLEPAVSKVCFQAARPVPFPSVYADGSKETSHVRPSERILLPTLWGLFLAAKAEQLL